MEYNDLQPHQQRVVDEHNELHDCITRLELFIAQSPVFKTLPHTEQELRAIERSAQALERAAREFTKIAPAGDETASGLADSYDMAANEVRLQIPAYAAMQARNLAKIKAWDKASAPPQLERWDAASYPPSTFCRECGEDHGDKQLAVPDPLASKCRAALAAAPQPSNPSTPAGQVQALRDSLRTLVELCAIGDVDENTEAHGWGDAIKRAKALLEADAILAALTSNDQSQLENQMTACQAMPRYKCHKEVWAYKIARLELRDNPNSSDPKQEFGSMLGSLWLHPADEGYAPFQPSPEWRSQWQCKADAGGYYVLYGDGYTSYSPAKAFEDGYSLKD